MDIELVPCIYSKLKGLKNIAWFYQMLVSHIKMLGGLHAIVCPSLSYAIARYVIAKFFVLSYIKCVHPYNKQVNLQIKSHHLITFVIWFNRNVKVTFGYFQVQKLLFRYNHSEWRRSEFMKISELLKLVTHRKSNIRSD